MRSTRAVVGLRLLFLLIFGVGFHRTPPPAGPAPDAVLPLPEMTLAMARVSPPPCKEGMVLVDCEYCDEVVEECVRDRTNGRKGCLEYAAPTVCTGQVTHMHFCIDEYEFPNHKGDKPLIMQSWYDADKACRAIHKRVCKSHEWTLACEGPERLPYPYGYVRDARACHIDERSPMIDEKRFYSPQKEEEIACGSTAARQAERVPNASALMGYTT